MKIQIHNLSYCLGNSWRLLDDLSLLLASGDVVGLFGENGCGKTTFLQLVAGLIRPRSGSIMFLTQDSDGWIDATRWPLWKRSRWGIRYVPQENRIWPGMTVEEHVRLALENNPNESACKDVRDSIYDQIPPTSKIEQLSQGQQRFVLLMRSLMMRPRLLLADEPLAGLDSSFQNTAKAILRQMAAEGMSAILVEHDREAVNGLAGRQFLLKEGHLYAL